MKFITVVQVQVCPDMRSPDRRGMEGFHHISVRWQILSMFPSSQFERTQFVGGCIGTIWRRRPTRRGSSEPGAREGEVRECGCGRQVYNVCASTCRVKSLDSVRMNNLYMSVLLAAPLLRAMAYVFVLLRAHCSLVDSLVVRCCCRRT